MEKITFNKAALYTDCRHFPGDKPCVFHKNEQVVCSKCNYYLPIETKILITKLDAMGDVLRTTFLLPILVRKYPDAHITWIVSKKSKDVLKGNHLIDRIWLYEDSFLALANEKFDIVINLDLSQKSLDLAAYAKANKKYGFIKDEKGCVVPLNETAKKWLCMSAFDNVKKENKDTYQKLAADVCEVEFNKENIIVPLEDEAVTYAQKFFEEHKLFNKTIVGLNIGSGARWVSKRWPVSHWEALAKLLSKAEFHLVIFGGPEEEEIEKELLKHSKAISTGTNNTIERFFALITQIDIMVTGDTLGLHAALGLNKKIVALFGPTSPQEIEMYGKGEKIVVPRHCISCYKTSCENDEKDCLELISPEEVYRAVIDLSKK
ncbi:MAG: glycosyltransferase family 9 protein [Elusimicrobiota bacterium]